MEWQWMLFEAKDDLEAMEEKLRNEAHCLTCDGEVEDAARLENLANRVARLKDDVADSLCGELQAA